MSYKGRELQRYMEVELQDGMSVLREVGAELETKYMEKIKVPRAEDEKR